jgi:autotransporter-associated beta strand protein
MSLTNGFSSHPGKWSFAPRFSRIAVVLIVLLAFGQTSSAQTVITQWNFNNYTLSSSSPPPSFGTGVATLLGGTTGSYQEIGGTTDPGSPDPLDPTTMQSRVWQITNFPAANAGSGTAGGQFTTSTVGRTNLIFTFDFRASAQGSRWYQIQYTTDGTNYLPVGGPVDVLTTSAWANSTTVNFAGIAGTASANFGVRVVSVFEPGTSAYAGAGGAYNPSGQTRFDMVTFAQGKQWTNAGGGNLQDGGNWDTGAPVSGTISSNLFFGNTASASVTVNNVSDFRALTIAFTGPNTGYTIGGTGALRLGQDSVTGLGGLTTLTNVSGRTQTFSAPVVVERRQVWNAGSAAGSGLVFNGSLTMTDVFTIAGSSDTTFNGSINSLFGSAITKSGPGTLILNATSPNGAGIILSQGTLRVANPSGGSATGVGAVSIAASAKLMGAQGLAAGTRGFIDGNVTVNGIVQPGTTATTTSGGQLNFTGSGQTVTFASGSKYTWDLADLADAAASAGIAYDQIRASNGPGLSLSGGAVELAFSGATTPNAAVNFWKSPHTWTILQVAGPSVNTTQFAGISNASSFASAGAFSLSQGTAGTILLNFTPVPEPGFVLAVMFAGVGLVARLRRAPPKA